HLAAERHGPRVEGLDRLQLLDPVRVEGRWVAVDGDRAGAPLGDDVGGRLGVGENEERFGVLGPVGEAEREALGGRGAAVPGRGLGDPVDDGVVASLLVVSGVRDVQAVPGGAWAEGYVLPVHVRGACASDNGADLTGLYTR